MNLFKNLSIVVICLLVLFAGGLYIYQNSATVTELINKELGLNQVPEVATKKAKRAELKGKVKRATVKKVVDGDTIELTNGTRVRYLNIDTPETVKPNTPIMCYGPEAKAANTKLLEKNQEIFLTIDKNPSDRYGRDLRFIYTDQADADGQKIEKSVNAQMVKNGLARASVYKDNNTYKTEFESWQQTAMDKKVGIWGKCPKPFEA
jgi:micrococcal nuclease